MRRVKKMEKLPKRMSDSERDPLKTDLRNRGMSSGRQLALNPITLTRYVETSGDSKNDQSRNIGIEFRNNE